MYSENYTLISTTLKNSIGFTYMTLPQTACIDVKTEDSLVVCTIP